MIRDLRAGLPPLPPDAVVVVGSGAAGIAVARRLRESGRPVVLLESGPGSGRLDEDDLNLGTVLGQPYRGLREGRSRTLGGTTDLWHGQCMRLHPLDVQARDWVPGSGWPLSLAELETPYAEAERWLGVSGRGYGPERWLEHRNVAPLDWNPRHLRHDFTEYTAHPHLGRVHRSALAADPGIVVLTGATVAAVTTADGAARGVTVAAPDGARIEVPAAQVVLCAGAVENARILLLSDPAGIGLGTGKYHTGRYLQDHPVIRTAEVLGVDHRTLQDRYVALHRGRRRLFAKLRLAPEGQAAHGLLDATAVFAHDHDEPGPAAARRLLNAVRSRRAPERPWHDAAMALTAPGPLVRDAYRRYAHGLSTASRPSAVWLQIWLEQAPDPDSRIVLDTATDRLGLRRARVDWRVGDLELRTSRLMTRWIGEDLARLGIGRLRELPAMTDDEQWRASTYDAYHPSGTTRMSDDPQGGVVGRDLQVHGVTGLFVVGGSVFPTAGYANPTLTIVALALRLADHLSRRPAAVG